MRLTTLAIVVSIALHAHPARAILDIEDRGPVLNAGGFALRVTNCGIVGNAFFDVGRSSDPSFEFPPHSGHEVLNYAALWVGGLDENGEKRVSGGPIMEWRPTLDPKDRVLRATNGQPGTRRQVDDDGDGRVDEEILNGKDDDGDHEIDEDLGFTAQEMMAADYVDDRPEAVQFVYEGGERHQPFGLSVHQEVYAWATPGYQGIAGLQYTITNHTHRTIRDLQVGLLVDLDSRSREDRGGHLNDRIENTSFTRVVNDGVSLIKTIQVIPYSCVRALGQTLPMIVDGSPGSRLPVATVVPLDHTIDPLGFIPYWAPVARAPKTVSFRTSTFSRAGVPGSGGIPRLDAQRYDALAGNFPSASGDRDDDYVVLVSCGPFASLAPGQSIEFAAALVAAPDRGALRDAVGNALFLHHGTTLNLVRDSTGRDPLVWFEGTSGINGHEVCLEAPPGRSFYWDPDCTNKFRPDELRPPEIYQYYDQSHCIWTDADCDPCTGVGGRETIQRWLDPGAVPPSPTFRSTPLDHAVRIEWDNTPEVVIGAGKVGLFDSRFTGYRVYRVSDWRDRASLLPPLANWSLVAEFGPDTDHGAIPLASVTDTTVDYDRILYRRKVYPVGRYVTVDSLVKNGFDYVYTVTTVSESGDSARHQIARHESPIDASFERRVVPHAAAQTNAHGVWVVPNPFRASAGWDRPVVSGDPLTRHIDFMGLPRARSTIKIWTVSGDLVAVIDHDGANGDGEAPWNLISRNGQDVESGLYLFTVDSDLGHQVGRFVVVR